ncbi:flavin reductase family protein [Streptomyces aurantiacus]
MHSGRPTACTDPELADQETTPGIGVHCVLSDVFHPEALCRAAEIEHARRQLMIDRDAFVELMSGVCAPVTVITATGADRRPHGSTVSSFASLSLDPPLVSFALDRASGLLNHLQPGDRVGVNILGAHQRALASAFARRSQEGSKFDGVAWTRRAGLPHLPESAGWTAGLVQRHVDGGDHILLVVCVEEAETTPVPPLTYARRVFGTHTPLAVAS